MIKINEEITNVEAPVTQRNFRHSADIENFYRFVFQGELRREAHILLGKYLASKNKSKRGRKPKRVLH